MRRSNNKGKLYLKGITSIRFFFALFVVLLHCNHNLQGLGIYWFSNAPILNKGSLAVKGFFILSGFLLTYLAYYEIKENQRLNIKRFFQRRVLRIFPLYYLAVLLGYLSMGYFYPLFLGETYFSFPLIEGILSHIFFIPNWIAAKYTSNVGSLNSLWTIGVEEQFYLIFPFIITLVINYQKPIKLLIFITLSYHVLQSYIVHFNNIGLSDTWIRFIDLLLFQYMLIGATFAFIFIKYRSHIESILNLKSIQTILFLLVLVPFTTRILDSYDFISGVFIVLFLILLTRGRILIINFENSILKYLGKISYGIYIYHGLVSYPLRFFYLKSPVFENMINNSPLVYYLIESTITIMVSHFSYIYYERWFLKQKLY